MGEEHVEEALAEAILGTLPEGDRLRVEAHVRTCASCAALRDRLELIAAQHQPPPVAPSPEALPPLMARVTGARRFSHLVPRAAELFDLSAQAVESLLATVDDPASWQEGPAEGVRVRRVKAGPGRGRSVGLLIRAEPHSTFPEHLHLGEEQVLILQGGLRSSDGRELWRGDEEVFRAGTSHSLQAMEGPPCICAVLTTFADQRD